MQVPAASNLMIMLLISIFGTTDQINPTSLPDDRWEAGKEGRTEEKGEAHGGTERERGEREGR